MGCTAHKKYSILVLVGSARKKSVNVGIIAEIQRIAIEDNIKLTLIIPSLQHLPIFSEDEQNKLIMPKAIKQLRSKAEEADAILFVTPEINGSVSPLVLNAFVWLSRAKNKQNSPLLYKKAGVISASFLSENQIVDCIQMGKFFNMNFFNRSFYLFLGNKVASQDGKVTSCYQKGRLEEWYKEFILFIIKE